MKIVLFDYVFEQDKPPGTTGLSSVVWDTAKTLVALGDDVHIVAPYPVEAQPPEGVTLHRFPLPPINYRNVIGHILIAWRGWQVIRRIPDIDIVLAPEYLSIGIFTLLNRDPSLPIVLRVPGNVHERVERGNPFDWSMTLVLKITAALAAASTAAVIVTSREMAYWWAKTGVSPSKMFHIPTGVDTEHYRPMPNARTALGLSEDTPSILYIGRFSHEKGVLTLLEAIHQLQEEIPTLELHLLGGGPQETLIRQRAEAYGLTKRVVFHGWVDRANTPLFYSAANITVLPSLSEGLPRIMLEALSCGAPFIGTRITGVVDCVTDGETGRLVPPNDASALADGIRDLLNNPDEAQQLGQTARTFMQHHFGWHAIMKRTRSEVFLPCRQSYRPEKGRRMNIVHILGKFHLPRDPDTAAASGVPRVALEVARQQAQLGHDVSVVAVDQQPWRNMWNGVTLIGLKRIEWAKISLLGRTLDFRQHLAYVLLTLGKPFDIVHGHIYSYMRFLRGKGHVAQFHSDPFYPGRDNEGLDLKPDDFRTIAHYSDAQIGVSNFVADELRRGFGEQGNVHTVYNGINIEEFDSERAQDAGKTLRIERDIPDDAVVFLFSGAVVKEKGLIHLARAFATLAAERDDVHLMVAGVGRLWGGALIDPNEKTEYEREIETILQEASARGKVHSLGRVASSKMPTVYTACDVLVVPSTWREAFGLVAVEALASKRPVIASRTGGLIEIVNEEHGYLVEPEDEDGLLAAMRTLADDPALRTRLGEHGRTYVAEHFSWEQAARQLISIYQTILGEQ